MHIIGIGSPFGDDRLGWVAAEQLKNSPVIAALNSEFIKITVSDRPGAALINALHNNAAVILIDAVCSGAPVGSVHRLEGNQITANASRLLSTHGFGVTTAIELARALRRLPWHLVFYGIEISPGPSGEALSAATETALPDLLRQVEREVGRMIYAKRSNSRR